MSMTFRYGSGVAVLPASIIKKIDRASKKDIKILLCLAAMPETMQKAESDPTFVAAACGCTETELATALAFWRGAGIIESDEENIEEAEQMPPEEQPAENIQTSLKPRPQRSDELPKYTTEELAVLLESRKDAAQLINECQNVIGKIFNPAEVNIVLALIDYLGLDGQFIFVLFDYCSRRGKKSLRYIEKKAFGLVDEGITTVESLAAYIEKMELISSLEGQIRALFGMKDRELTTKEKKFIEKWITKFGYGIDVIKKAYEVTVDAIHEPSPAYANAVLERWNKEGLTTLADIERAQSEALPSEGSFDTDDFFEAALKRSMEKMKED